MKGSLASAAQAVRPTSDGQALRLLQRPSEAAPARASVGFGEISSRMAIVAAFTFLAVRLGADFMETGRFTGLLLLASEALVVVLTVFRRPTGIVDRSIPARALTTVSLIGPLFVGPASAGLLPELATVTLSAIGLVIVIAGKLSLGRSFGLMPANRGIVSTGLYRLIRHPIYLGYLITHVGFLAANASLWNVLVFVGADVALMLRAVYEERVLARDASYRDYQQTVQWRLVPGLF